MPHLKPVGDQNSDRNVGLSSAIAAFTSVGTTSPQHIKQQDMQFRVWDIQRRNRRGEDTRRVYVHLSARVNGRIAKARDLKNGALNKENPVLPRSEGSSQRMEAPQCQSICVTTSTAPPGIICHQHHQRTYNTSREKARRLQSLQRRDHATEHARGQRPLGG